MLHSEPKLAQFGPAIRWLLAKDISSSRLASLFNTTAENMVVHFFEVIDSYLQELPNETPVRLMRARLWETPTCFAEITREDYDAAE